MNRKIRCDEESLNYLETKHGLGHWEDGASVFVSRERVVHGRGLVVVAFFVFVFFSLFWGVVYTQL
jgi:hypothetical protein